MTKDAAKHDKTERKRWLHIFSAVFLTVVIIVGATSVWLRSTRRSSERTVNEMAEFYLGETAERNSRAIIFELEKWMQQLERIVTNLSPEDLSSEQRIRDFVGSIQQINGADLFALVDEQGKVYTSGSVYPDGSAFSFLSKPITQPAWREATRTRISSSSRFRLPVPRGRIFRYRHAFSGLPWKT